MRDSEARKQIDELDSRETRHCCELLRHMDGLKSDISALVNHFGLTFEDRPARRVLKLKEQTVKVDPIIRVAS